MLQQAFGHRGDEVPAGFVLACREADHLAVERTAADVHLQDLVRRQLQRLGFDVELRHVDQRFDRSRAVDEMRAGQDAAHDDRIERKLSVLPLVLPPFEVVFQDQRTANGALVVEIVHALDVHERAEAAHEIRHFQRSIAGFVEARPLLELIERRRRAAERGKNEDGFADRNLLAVGEELAVLHRREKPAQPTERHVVKRGIELIEKKKRAAERSSPAPWQKYLSSSLGPVSCERFTIVNLSAGSLSGFGLRAPSSAPSTIVDFPDPGGPNTAIDSGRLTSARSS